MDNSAPNQSAITAGAVDPAQASLTATPTTVTPSSSSPTSLVAPSGTPANGSFGVNSSANPVLQPTPLPSTIDSSQLNQTPTQVPTQTPSTTPPSTVNYAEQALQNAPVQDTPTETTAKALTSQLTTLLPELSGQTEALYSEQNALGVPELTSDLQNYNNQIKELQAQIGQTDTTLVANQREAEQLRGLLPFQQDSSAQLAGNAQIADALTTSKIGVLNAQVLATQGNIDLANTMAQRAVAIKYAPIQDAVNTYQAQLTALQPLLTVDEQKQSDAISFKNSVALKQIDQQVSQQQDAITNINTAITNGTVDTSAGYQAISDLISGKTDVSGAYSALAINPDGTPNVPGTPTATKGAGSGALVVASKAGIADPSIPLSTAIANVGLNKIVSGIIANENSQIDPSLNNPGDIKFANLPGQTDSGIKASDGGTWASYATPQAGQNAIATLVQNASKAGSTFQDFMNSYTNTVPTTNQTGYDQYGLLSTKTDFNPNSVTDLRAQQYLKILFSTGQVPSPIDVVGSRNLTNKTLWTNIQARADNLYFQATGQSLSGVNTDQLKTYNDLVSSNNTLVNNLGVQENTIQKNFGLNLENLTANNINTAVPFLNGIFNAIDTALGEPGTAQYNLQNATLQQEAGNLMAVKNASGTTVYDKMVGAGLIPKNASQTVQAQLMKTLLQEASNAKDAIASQNASLYQQIDPLEQNSDNPNRDTTNGITTPAMDFQAVQTFYTASSANQEVVDNLHTEFPNATITQIRQALGI